MNHIERARGRSTPCTTARLPPAASAPRPCRAWTWPRCRHANDPGTTGRATETPATESLLEQAWRTGQEAGLHSERTAVTAPHPAEAEGAGAPEQGARGPPPGEGLPGGHPGGCVVGRAGGRLNHLPPQPSTTSSILPKPFCLNALPPPPSP